MKELADFLRSAAKREDRNWSQKPFNVSASVWAGKKRPIREFLMHHIDWATWESVVEDFMILYPSKKMLALPYKNLPTEAYYNIYQISSLTPLLDAIFNTPIIPLKPEDLKKFL